MRTSWASVTVLVATLGTAPALAQPSGALNEDQFLEASIKQAKAQIATGELMQALRTLQEAYQRVPTPALLWPIADLHLRLQQPSEGLAILDRYVAQVRPAQMPPGQRLPDVERMREALRGQFARLQITGARGDSTVLVDDVEVARTPLAKPLSVNPGRRRLEVRYTQGLKSEVQLQPGQEVQLNLSTDEARAAVRPMEAPRGRGPSKAQVVLGGLGLAAIAAGGVLWGLDGYQSCAQAPLCPQELDSKTPGVALVSLGAGVTASALVWWIYDVRTRARAER